MQSTCPTAALRVEHLCFAYGTGDPVLRDVSLTLAAGEKLALVGPTGAGKSTLAKLMARLYDPTDGTVTFAGTDLRRANVHSLRTRITVVPQEGFLFAGTIREASASVGPTRLMPRSKLGPGVARAVGPLPVPARRARHRGERARGSRLSAGERQLVSLARAALAGPAVLVFDEATSSLDPGTEVLVERALEKLVQGRTVIVIAHRLSTSGPGRPGGGGGRRRPRGAGHPRRPGGRRRPLRPALPGAGSAASPRPDVARRPPRRARRTDRNPPASNRREPRARIRPRCGGCRRG